MERIRSLVSAGVFLFTAICFFSFAASAQEAQKKKSDSPSTESNSSVVCMPENDTTTLCEDTTSGKISIVKSNVKNMRDFNKCTSASILDPSLISVGKYLSCSSMEAMALFKMVGEKVDNRVPDGIYGAFKIKDGKIESLVNVETPRYKIVNNNVIMK